MQFARPGRPSPGHFWLRQPSARPSHLLIQVVPPLAGVHAAAAMHFTARPSTFSHSDKPPEQDAVVDFFHQKTLAADRIQHEDFHEIVASPYLRSLRKSPVPKLVAVTSRRLTLSTCSRIAA